MQIREQGKQVQLIRSPYDQSKKRCVQKVVHHFKQQFLYLSDDVTKYLSAEQLADLSADETKTLSAWLKTKTDKKLSDDKQYTLSAVVQLINRLTDIILSDGIDANLSADVETAVKTLSAALRKKSVKSVKTKTETIEIAVKPAKPKTDSKATKAVKEAVRRSTKRLNDAV